MKAQLKKILFLIFLIFNVFLLISVSADQNINENQEVTLYVVIPTSGDLESAGRAANTAINIAVDNMNDLLRSIGSDPSIRLNYTDITSDPQSALEAVQKLHHAGVQMVLGYLSSSQIEAIREYADTNDILILSSGSTESSLAINGDNILRFNPDDKLQAEAIKSLLDGEEIADIVPLVRDDIWGNELVHSVYIARGNDTTLNNTVRYAPGKKSFTETLVQLDNEVGTTLMVGDAQTIGVLVISSGEIFQIMDEASDPKYVNLSVVRWFGVDEDKINSDLIITPTAATFAAERKLIITTYFPNSQTRELSPYTRLTKELGYEPGGYTCAIYDMVKIAFLSDLLRGVDNASAKKYVVAFISGSSKGLTGDMILNDAGDRAFGNYAYWIFTQDKTGAATWKFQGEFQKYSRT